MLARTAPCSICLEPPPHLSESLVCQLACCGKQLCNSCAVKYVVTDQSVPIDEDPHMHANLLPRTEEEHGAVLQRHEKQGRTWAQFALGLGYLHGTGVERDAQKAVELRAKAAAQGHAPAQ